MKRHIRWDTILLIAGIICLLIYGGISCHNAMTEKKSAETIQKVRSMRAERIVQEDAADAAEPKDVITTSYDNLFAANADMIAWLSIPDTDIDYPVMQTMEDEEYYLHRDFFGEYDKNGCLLLDTDSDIDKKGTNLIIHGHNMRSGAMFGGLEQYKDSEYGAAHSSFYLYTKEGRREYALIAAFYSKVYNQDEQAFKYYQYFGSTDEETFNDFYTNIKQLGIYDTGVTAECGDEFLTLSTCAYHTKNGRFVVVAKRIAD